MDPGFTGYPFFDWITGHGHGFITRARSGAATWVQRGLLDAPTARDRVVRLGPHRANPCAHPVRVVEVQVHGTWRAYPTNVLVPRLPGVADVIDPYGRRGWTEEAFLATMRLLGLSNLWSGAHDAVAVQVWTSWLRCTTLVDLSDRASRSWTSPSTRGRWRWSCETHIRWAWPTKPARPPTRSPAWPTQLRRASASSGDLANTANGRRSPSPP